MRRSGEACPADVGHAHRAGRVWSAGSATVDSRDGPMVALAGSPTNGDLGRTIRGLREERRLTIEGLGFAAGVHPTYLSGIERGVRNPTWRVLRSLADALQIPVADLVRCAESTARVRKGLERVLASEEALQDAQRARS